MKSLHWLYLTFVLFSFLRFYLRCWRLLIQLALMVSQCGTVLRGPRESVFNSSETWLTSSRISNDVDGKPCSGWPTAKRSHVESFLLWRKGPGYGFKWQTCLLYCIFVVVLCILYCIVLSTGFTVWKLYYVSILFYYASVFDFPKYIETLYCFMLWQKILPSLKKWNFRLNLIWNCCRLHVSTHAWLRKSIKNLHMAVTSYYWIIHLVRKCINI